MKCPYQCNEVGGPWIAENPDCPFHGPNAVQYEKPVKSVYIGFECAYNGVDMWRNVDQVFLDEHDAQYWVDQKHVTEFEWREYEEFEAK